MDTENPLTKGFDSSKLEKDLEELSKRRVTNGMDIVMYDNHPDYSDLISEFSEYPLLATLTPNDGTVALALAKRRVEHEDDAVKEIARALSCLKQQGVIRGFLRGVLCCVNLGIPEIAQEKVVCSYVFVPEETLSDLTLQFPELTLHTMR